MSLQIDALVCDLDGVIYRGDEPIEGAARAVNALRAAGVSVLFATNNSRHTVAEYVTRLEGFGIAAGADEIITSAVVLGEELSAVGVEGARAMVIGGRGLRVAVEEAGAEVVDGAGEVDLVAVGWDLEFSYEKMRRAGIAVRGGALFYASNNDATFPASDGTMWPGAGSILASIEMAGGRTAIVVGKPNEPMVEACARRLGGAHKVAVVGDRPDTDLAVGVTKGWLRILVTTGVVSPEDALGVEPAPDMIIGGLGEILEAMKEGR